MSWDMPSPSMALNAVSPDRDRAKNRSKVLPYTMDYNEAIDSDEKGGYHPAISREEVIDKIKAVVKSVKLKSLVINCHGRPAYLELGEGFTTLTVYLFERVRARIETIWISSCNVAKVVQEKSNDSDGFLFCRNLAYWSGAHVFASDVLQEQKGYTKLKKGQIDPMEKPVYEFFPDWEKEPEEKPWYWSP